MLVISFVIDIIVSHGGDILGKSTRRTLIDGFGMVFNFCARQNRAGSLLLI